MSEYSRRDEVGPRLHMALIPCSDVGECECAHSSIVLLMFLVMLLGVNER